MKNQNVSFKEISLSIVKTGLHYEGSTTRQDNHVESISNLNDFISLVKNHIHFSYQFDGKATKENSKNAFGLILDFDAGLTIDEFKKSYLGENFNYILYTSKSHKVVKVKESGKTYGARERFHVFFPFFDTTTVNKEKGENSTENIIRNFIITLNKTEQFNLGETRVNTLISEDVINEKYTEDKIKQIIEKGTRYVAIDESAMDIARPIFPSRKSGISVDDTDMIVIYQMEKSYLDYDYMKKFVKNYNDITSLQPKKVQPKNEIVYENSRDIDEKIVNKAFDLLTGNGYDHMQRMFLGVALYNFMGENGKELLLKVKDSDGTKKAWNEAKINIKNNPSKYNHNIAFIIDFVKKYVNENWVKEFYTEIGYKQNKTINNTNEVKKEITNDDYDVILKLLLTSQIFTKNETDKVKSLVEDINVVYEIEIDKKGNEKTVINKYSFFKYLTKLGFRKFQNKYKNGDIEVVLKYNNFLTIVSKQQISNFVVELSKIFGCDSLMMTTFTKFLSIDDYLALDQSGENSIPNGVLFKNGYWNKGFHKYDENVCILRDSSRYSLNKNFNKKEVKNSNTEKFIKDIARDEMLQLNDKRNDFYKKVLGYYLTPQKDMTNAPAFILTEFNNDISIKGANGRTGKSSTIQNLLSKYIKVATVNGASYNPLDPKSHKDVKNDTTLLFIDEFDSNLNEMYSMVTTTMEVKNLYSDVITLNFEESPKIIMTTNKPTKVDESKSTKRRFFEIEFSNFYQEINFLEYFGCDESVANVFFSDKNQEDMTDNFMCECFDLYQGDKRFYNSYVKAESTLKNKVIITLGEEKVHYLSEMMEDVMILNNKLKGIVERNVYGQLTTMYENGILVIENVFKDFQMKHKNYNNSKAFYKDIKTYLDAFYPNHTFEQKRKSFKNENKQVIDISCLFKNNNSTPPTGTDGDDTFRSTDSVECLFDTIESKIEVKQVSNGNTSKINGVSVSLEDKILKLHSKNMTADEIADILSCDIKAVEFVLNKGVKPLAVQQEVTPVVKSDVINVVEPKSNLSVEIAPVVEQKISSNSEMKDLGNNFTECKINGKTRTFYKGVSLCDDTVDEIEGFEEDYRKFRNIKSETRSENQIDTIVALDDTVYETEDETEDEIKNDFNGVGVIFNNTFDLMYVKDEKLYKHLELENEKGIINVTFDFIPESEFDVKYEHLM